MRNSSRIFISFKNYCFGWDFFEVKKLFSDEMITIGVKFSHNASGVSRSIFKITTTAIAQTCF